jgi:probable phosphoglycerate mutase
MGHEPNVRTRNAVPVWCEPPVGGATVWEITYAD